MSGDMDTVSAPPRLLDHPQPRLSRQYTALPVIAHLGNRLGYAGFGKEAQTAPS